VGRWGFLHREIRRRLPKLTESGGAEERKDWVPDKGVLGSSLRYEGQAEFFTAENAEIAERF